MSKMTPKITIEKSKGQHIETLITSERSKILTFRKKRWQHNDRIFQIRSTCFFDPGPPLSPINPLISIGDIPADLDNLSRVCKLQLRSERRATQLETLEDLSQITNDRGTESSQ